VAHRSARFRRARVAATIALSVVIGTGIAAGGFAPAVAAARPVAKTFGLDCRENDGALARADALMAGELKLSRHKAFRLPRDPTWAEDPFNDRNWEFQYHSLRFLWDLFEAWRITGDRAYQDRGLNLLHDWVRDNPRGAARSGFAWNDHSTAIRTFVLACAAAVAPKKAWIRDALRTHAAALADPDFYVHHGNHALNQSRGLLAAGCVLGRQDWQRLAADRIAGLLAESVDRQGVTNEQSVYYQLYNLEAYRAAARRMEACGIAVPRAFRRLDRMINLLTHATLPDGTYTALGDTSHAPARAIRGTTAAFAATGGRKGRMPAATFATFDAGYAFGRTGWGTTRAFEDEVMWSARFGPGRVFHGHLDHGSVTLYGYGSRLVDDPGLFTLNNNRWRDFAMSRAAHNVITVSGVPYRASSSARLERAKTGAAFDDITIVDPGYPGVDLRRRVVFSRGLGWLLVDDRASTAAVRTYRQRWHLLPGTDPMLAGTTIRTRTCGGNVAIFQFRPVDEMRVIEGGRAPVQGWYSTTLNRRKPAPTVEAIRTGRTVRYTTLLVPLPRPNARVHVAGVSVAKGRVTFTLTVDGRGEGVTIAPAGVEIERRSGGAIRRAAALHPAGSCSRD
jgi:Heparinase II/III-like protein/Heparinase II/III N-terminus